MTTPEAAALLSVSIESLKRVAAGGQLRRRVASDANDPRGVGWLWYRPDLEFVRTIRRECHTSLAASIRFAAALRERRLTAKHEENGCEA